METSVNFQVSAVNWNEGPHCGKEFDNAAQVDAHVAAVHGVRSEAPVDVVATGRKDAPVLSSDDVYECEECGATFASATAYALHVLIFRGKRTPDNGLIWVTVNGFDLALFPWEDAQIAVAEAEAILQEKDAKPGYGLEVDVLPWEVADEPDETAAWLVSNDEPDELALMAADLDALRLGLVKPLATAWVDDGERIGVEFCERPYLY